MPGTTGVLAEGATGVYDEYVTVYNVNPTATLNGPTSGVWGTSYTYSFSGQSDPSGADTTAGFHYAYDCNGGSLAAATYATSGTSATR